MNETDNKFRYKYSAPTENERREVEEIQKQYLTDGCGDDKLMRLRKLNARVKNISMCVSLSCGVIGLLLFGAGMSLVLAFENVAAGIVVSVVGLFPMAAAHPVYNFVLKKCKKKYGEEILRLSEEILNERK